MTGEYVSVESRKVVHLSAQTRELAGLRWTKKKRDLSIADLARMGRDRPDIFYQTPPIVVPWRDEGRGEQLVALFGNQIVAAMRALRLGRYPVIVLQSFCEDELRRLAAEDFKVADWIAFAVKGKYPKAVTDLGIQQPTSDFIAQMEQDETLMSESVTIRYAPSDADFLCRLFGLDVRKRRVIAAKEIM